MKRPRHQGYTVVEVLTVVSIITVLTAVFVPALHRARCFGRRVLSIHHQREIVNAVTLYACDSDGLFPPSVALCQISGSRFRWQDPRKVKTTRPRENMRHNSVAGYMAAYLLGPEILHCPSSPGRADYWREAWQAADRWDHPETQTLGDPVFGSYCLYWNYVGHRSQDRLPFRGPTRLGGGPGESTLLVSDYFGADEWRGRGAFGSCEPFPGAEPVGAGDTYAPYWSRKRQGDLQARGGVSTRLYGGYSDGHVADCAADDTVVLEAAEDAEGNDPYGRGDERWPGYFFVPQQAVPQTPY